MNIWEPYEAFFRLTSIFSGKKKSATPTSLVSGKNKSVFQKIATWIRGNLIIPDPRVFWVRPSVNFLSDFIEAKGIKTVITTGPPHSIHLIGLKLKQRNSRLNWLADFRDPWSEWGLLDSLNVSSLVRKRHRQLEKKVLTRADAVTTITPFYVRHFSRLSGRNVHLLTNGHDESDFEQLAPVRTEHFVIRHVGIVNEKCDPRPFMLALKEIMLEHDEFRSLVRIEFVGEIHPEFRRFVEKEAELQAVTHFVPSVPHKELIKLYNKSSVLLLVLTGYKDAEGYMPGKLFEYLAVGFPILGVGPVDGDAAGLIKESLSGEMVDGSDRQKLKEVLGEYFVNWRSSPVPVIKKSSMARYSRHAITGRLVELLERLGMQPPAESQPKRDGFSLTVVPALFILKFLLLSIWILHLFARSSY
jgi:glycosyltransferase involved in cell wall biosynthesis